MAQVVLAAQVNGETPSSAAASSALEASRLDDFDLCVEWRSLQARGHGAHRAGEVVPLRHLSHSSVGCVTAGYEVITFDAPAHGASQGKRTNLMQWMHILEQLLQRTGPVHAVIGHSLGGLNAALTLVHKPVRVPRLVMVSAAVSAPVFFNETFQLFSIPQQVMPKLQGIIMQRLRGDLQELDLFRHINQIKADQILVAYDENDHLVKQEQVNAFIQQYPSIESLRIKGEGHFRIMKDETVINKVLTFLEK